MFRMCWEFQVSRSSILYCTWSSCTSTSGPLGGAGGLDWTAEFNGYEYDVTYSTPEAELSWYDARAECMSEGGDLASIESDAEDDFIGTIVGTNV